MFLNSSLLVPFSNKSFGLVQGLVNSLLYVTKQGHTAQYPVIWILIGLQEDSCNVGQVCSARFLVDGTLVHSGVLFVRRSINGVYVNDWHGLEQDFGFGFDKFAAPLVPASAL